MRNLWASFDFLVHFLIIFFIVQSFKNEILSKILDIQKYNIVRHWFSSKNWIFAIFLRKFLLTVLLIFHRKYTPNFQKIDFSIYPNILYISDQNFMLVPTIKLLEFSDKKLRNLWASFDFLVHFLIIFFIVQSFKNEILSKILDIQKYNIVRHWFSSKNWIFAIFFKKVSIDGFIHFSSKIHPKFSKNRLFHIPQYIIYLWSEFYARSNNQTIRIFG